MAPSQAQRFPVRTIVVLGALSAFGPITIDLYLPGLPQLARDLHTSAGTAQVTLTACVLGLAIGQMFAGPIGDAIGRRRPLLAGLALFTASSAGCALVNSITLLALLRAVEGLGGAAGIALSRAMVRDRFSGREAARVYSSLAAILFIAPIIAPLLGGFLLHLGNWRVLFWCLAAIGGALLIATAAWTTETHSRALRSPMAFGEVTRTFGILLRDRAYLSYATPTAFSAVVMFGFLTSSSFVYQDVFGFSPLLYGVLFGINGVLLVAASITNRRLLARFRQQWLLEAGLIWVAVSGCAVAVAAVAGLGAAIVVPLVWVTCTGLGLVMPNATALALADQGARAGSASGLMGLLQFLIAAIVPTIVGAVGTSTVTMGVVMATGGLLSGSVYRVLRARTAAVTQR